MSCNGGRKAPSSRAHQRVRFAADAHAAAQIAAAPADAIISDATAQAEETPASALTESKPEGSPPPQNLRRVQRLRKVQRQRRRHKRETGSTEGSSPAAAAAAASPAAAVPAAVDHPVVNNEEDVTSIPKCIKEEMEVAKKKILRMRKEYDKRWERGVKEQKERAEAEAKMQQELKTLADRIDLHEGGYSLNFSTYIRMEQQQASSSSSSSSSTETTNQRGSSWAPRRLPPPEPVPPQYTYSFPNNSSNCLVPTPAPPSEKQEYYWVPNRLPF